MFTSPFTSLHHTSRQVFNPGYVEGSPATNYVSGLIVRTQNCTNHVGGSCLHCGGTGASEHVAYL